jgi:hypothetical protein
MERPMTPPRSNKMYRHRALVLVFQLVGWGARAGLRCPLGIICLSRGIFIQSRVGIILVQLHDDK